MKKIIILLCISFILLQPTKVFALKESDWDIFDINGIYYFDKDAENCTTSNLSGTIGKLYDGNEIISKSDLEKISANRQFYERSAARYGFPWQLLATIHYRETSLRRYNPTNGQGIYQLYSYTGGGKNSNWLMIKTDHGKPSSANLIPGAFLIFSSLGGSSGISSCSGGGGNLSINQTALNLAWNSTGHGITPNDNYRNALIETGINRLGDRWSMMGASCDAFVATVLRFSGIDKNFVCCGVSNGGPTSNYVKNSGKFIEVENRQGSLKPGDIRLGAGHIEIYVEQNGVGKIASASHGSRTGELLPFYDNSRTFKAYRFIGNTNK